MTIYQIFLQALKESQEIICLRSWAWEQSIDYKNAHTALKRAKKEYPKQVKISRLRNEQGRPLYVKWIGE